MSVRPVRPRLVVGVAAVALLVAAAPASAAWARSTSSSLSGTLSVSPSKVTGGHTVAFGGEVPTSGPGSCPAADAITLTSTGGLFPARDPQVARENGGAYRVDYTVPTKTVAGPYSIGVRCGRGIVDVSVALTVANPAPTTKVFPETRSMMVHLNRGQRLLGEIVLVAAVVLFATFAAWMPRPSWRRRSF